MADPYATYNLEEAARFCGLPADVIRLAARTGELQAYSLPTERGLVFREEDLAAFRRRHEGGAARRARALGWYVNTEDK